MTSKEIRQQFLDFFRSKGHAIVESSPVVPVGDPTLMFTNAGMNQFKDVFLGTGSRPYVRAADTQKCIRAGGKHNDLDDVGQDTYHHTFFEMLGNWSFGDYFKKEAIEWAWELLTKVYGIDKSRLHATYFEGDKSEGLEADSEAAELWRTATDIDPTHIHPGNKKDNFWEMGDTGPCGPCSEIHIDLTPDKSGKHLVNAGDARVMEIWNLVFIQFNRGTDGKLTPLPAKHVDTGMGFERLCSVLQGARAGRLGQFSNYDTDVFTPIFRAIQKRTGAADYQGTIPGEPPTSVGADAGSRGQAAGARDCGELRITNYELRSESAQSAIDNLQSTIMTDVSYRVIADHIRCLTFAITDGAVPSNEGRGYVLRRILRRAVRYGRQYMNMPEPFLCDLVQPLIDHMGDAFPELRKVHGGRNIGHVQEIIHDEEASFIKTLDRGIKLFSEAAEYARTHHRGKISGEDAFKLHDTYGFPIDLTELMAEEQGLTIDIGEYERLMEEARDRARESSKVGAIYTHQLSREMLQEQAGKTRFVGYASLSAESVVAGIVKGSDLSQFSLTLQTGEEGIVVLRESPFYGEKGGQVGDCGIIESSFGLFEVDSTQEIDGIIIHHGRCTRGILTCHKPDFAKALRRESKTDPKLGPPEAYERPVRAVVSAEIRLPTMKHHTSTHILNLALREVLGDHVQQKGSLVDPEKTRFDFSHNKPLSDEEIERIESLCREQIEANHAVFTKEVEQKKAREINTLRAVFGEKYPDVVRVVSIGADIDQMLADPKNDKWMKYSVEFCGGTHLKTSREAGAFVLTAEEGVAKGVRRVVGIAGDLARQAIARGEQMLKEADNRQSTIDNFADFQQRLTDAEIPVLVRRKIQARLAELQKQVKEQEKASAASSGEAVMEAVAALVAKAETVGGITIVVGEVPAASADALRAGIDWVRNKTSASAVLLATVADGKVTMIAGMSKVAVERGLKAGDLIKEISPLIGGKGGGRPDMAQGGGPDAAGLPNVLTQAGQWVKARL